MSRKASSKLFAADEIEAGRIQELCVPAVGAPPSQFFLSAPSDWPDGIWTARGTQSV